MDTKEEEEGREEGHEEVHEDRPPSPIWVLQHISEEAFRVAGEALQSVYSGNSSFPPLAPGHRRAQSEIGTMGHRRSNSFQRLKTQVQRAWGWGNSPQEEGCRSNFNPEVLANQKRQWYQLHPKTLVLVFFYAASLKFHLAWYLTPKFSSSCHTLCCFLSFILYLL